MAQPSNLKILALVEATTINAVARNVLDFQSSACELHETDPDFPTVEVSIVTFDRPVAGPASENEFIAAARARGMRVDVINERGRFDRRIVPALRRLVDEIKPDVVVTHSVKSHFVMFRSRLWLQVPWVAYHHGYTATDLKMRFYNLFDRRSLPRADRVLTVCKAFADDLAQQKGLARNRISVLHNSIRPAPRAPKAEALALREQLGITIGDRIILSVGRLSKEKAQADLIRAFARLRDTNPDLQAKLVIVGEGPERAKLEAETNSTGVADRVIFTGQVSNVRPYYAITDVLANVSHSEGSPYVLLEAMAAGVPIVATAVGGVPEMLSDGESATLVPPGDSAAMAAAMGRLLKDEDLSRRFVTNASDLAANRFSPETYVRSLVNIYSDIRRQ